MLTYTADDLEKIFKDENINPDELQNMVVEKLKNNNLKLATAESCTGGLLSGRITAVSGASEVFDCGVCSYANKIKHKVLGVSEETLNTLGAVSPETALQMAEGVKKPRRCRHWRKHYGNCRANWRNRRKTCGACICGNLCKLQ